MKRANADRLFSLPIMQLFERLCNTVLTRCRYPRNKITEVIIFFIMSQAFKTQGGILAPTDTASYLWRNVHCLSRWLTCLNCQPIW